MARRRATFIVVAEYDDCIDFDSPVDYDYINCLQGYDNLLTFKVIPESDEEVED